MSEEDEIDLLINDLVDLGALVKNNVDESGEIFYNVNAERMKEIYPAFYDLFMEELDDVMVSLVEKGLVSVEYDENLKVFFSLSEEGEQYIKNLVIE